MEPAIGDGPLVHPTAEHGADAAPQLFLGIGGKGMAQFPLGQVLEPLDDHLPVVGAEIHVQAVALVLLQVFQHVLKQARIQVQHHVAVHLDKAAIAVVGEALVTAAGGEALHGGVVETQVEHRVHHAGHGGPGAGAHRHQQRIFGVAEAGAHGLFHLGQGLGHFRIQAGRVGVIVVVVVGADFGGDGESRRHRHADVAHFSEVGALAAQQILHVGAPIGAAGSKTVYPLRHAGSPLVRWRMSRGHPSMCAKAATDSMVAPMRASSARRAPRKAGWSAFTVTRSK